MDFAEIYIGAVLYQADVDRIFGKLVNLEEYSDPEDFEKYNTDIEEILSKTPIITNTNLKVRYLSECFTDGNEKIMKDEKYVVVLGIPIMHLETEHRSFARIINNVAADIPKAVKEVSDLFSKYNIDKPVKVYALSVEN